MYFVREARLEDAKEVLALIKELAEYEKLEDQVTATLADLVHVVFREKTAGLFVAEERGKLIGYALWFRNVSTFKCRSGIYVEDIYVKKDERGRGIGKEMLLAVAKKAQTENCGRIEWSCLDWNEPSKGFYRSLGAVPMEGWTAFRVDESGFAGFIERCAEK